MVRDLMAQPPWYWLSEPLAMDFANTIHRRGMVDHDHLRTGADVAGWCEHEPGRVPRVTARAPRRPASPRSAPCATTCTPCSARRSTASPLPGAAVGADQRAGAGAADRRPDRRRPGRPARGDRDARGRRGRAARARRRRHDRHRRRRRSGRGALLRRAELRRVLRPRAGNQRWCDDACGTRARVARHAAAHRARGR